MQPAAASLFLLQDPPTACLPRCKRFVVRRLGSVPSSLPALLRYDPFLALLELLAALVTPRQAASGSGQWELHRDPASVLQVSAYRGATAGVVWGMTSLSMTLAA